MAVVAVVEASEPLTVDALVQMVWEEVRHRRSGTVSEAARRLLPGLDLPDELAAELAAVGLIALANNAQHYARRNGQRPIGFARPSGAQLAPYMRILSTPYEDAKGRQRPVLDFASADLDALGARCRTVGAGWMRRAKTVERLRRLLERHGARVVRDLPPDVLEQAAREFERTFGDGRSRA